MTDVSNPDEWNRTLVRAAMKEAGERRRGAEADLLCAEHIQLLALPAAVDLLDTLERFGDLSLDEDADADEKLRVIIGALKQAVGRLVTRAKAEASR